MANEVKKRWHSETTYKRDYRVTEIFVGNKIFMEMTPLEGKYERIYKNSCLLEKHQMKYLFTILANVFPRRKKKTGGLTDKNIVKECLFTLKEFKSSESN